MKKKGPAPLRGSLIARKGEAEPAGGPGGGEPVLRGTLADAFNGRPPVSVPTPPDVVDGRLGYRLQAGCEGPQPLAGRPQADQAPFVDRPQQADRSADSIRDYRPRFERPPPSEYGEGADAVSVAGVPDHQSRQAAVVQPRIDSGKARLPPAGAAAVRRPADTSGVNRMPNGSDLPITRSSTGEASSPQTAFRRDVRRTDPGRARPKAGDDSAGHGRPRSSASRRHSPRSRARKGVRRLALVAVFVALLAAGVGFYDRLGAPRYIVQAVQSVQETLINAFGSAAPLLAEAVGVSEGALVGAAEDPGPGSAVVELGAVADVSAGLATGAAVLDSDDGTDRGSAQPSPAAARTAEPLSASLPSPPTNVELGPVRGDDSAVALTAVPPGVQPGVSLRPADADKLPTPLTPLSAAPPRVAAAIDGARPTGLPANEPVSVTSIRLDAPAGARFEAPESLTVTADVAFPPKAAIVEAPFSTEAALATSEALARLGVPNGRIAIPISKPLDRAREVADRAREVVAAAAAPSAEAPFAVQLASYRSSELAAQAAAKLTEAYLGQLGSGAARVVSGPNGLFRVMSARMERRGDAVSLCDQLKTRGQDCLVVQR